MRLWLASLLMWGCSDARAKIRMVPNVGAGTQLALSQVATSESRIGSLMATDLRSPKYYVTGIELCQEVELSGSGVSNKQGCIALY
jgi:hypothetical protein